MKKLSIIFLITFAVFFLINILFNEKTIDYINYILAMAYIVNVSNNLYKAITDN